MAEENNQEKTEQATPRKRKEHRDKGEVAKSKELPSVAVLMAGCISLTLFGSYMYTNMQHIMQVALTAPMAEILSHPNQFTAFAEKLLVLFLIIVGPVLGVVFLTAILSNVMQVGFILSGESIKPKLSKLDPLKGFGRLFSKQAFMEAAKSILKLIIVGGVAFWTVKAEMPSVYELGGLETTSLLAYISENTIEISVKCTLTMILLVIIDFAYQKWEFEKRIRMSKQEIKDEFKKSEGDPLVKSRIRSIQMEMARKRMMQAVPQADVVITNPTHLAVALKYDGTQMKAPKVIAKGAGVVAQKIKTVAAEHGVPVVENKALARNLYAVVEIDQEIPQSLFMTVAEILAYVYQFKKTHTGSR